MLDKGESVTEDVETERGAWDEEILEVIQINYKRNAVIGYLDIKIRGIGETGAADVKVVIRREDDFKGGMQAVDFEEESTSFAADS